MQYITTKSNTLEIGRVCTTLSTFQVQPLIERPSSLLKNSVVAILPTPNFIYGEDLSKYGEEHVYVLIIDDQGLDILANELVWAPISFLQATNKLLANYSTIDEKVIKMVARSFGLVDNALGYIINTRGKQEALKLILGMHNTKRNLENFECPKCGSIGKLLNKNKPKPAHFVCPCGFNSATKETVTNMGRILFIHDPNKRKKGRLPKPANIVYEDLMDIRTEARDTPQPPQQPPIAIRNNTHVYQMYNNNNAGVAYNQHHNVATINTTWGTEPDREQR